MTQQRPTSPRRQQRDELGDALVTLAGTPDDDQGIDDRLVVIAQLAARRVEPVSYASVTVRREDAYTTVAASDDIALAVDEAQYADQSGPCLDALESGRPLAVPEIATTMRWPRFRDTAYRLGLCASVSVPLFAGRGEPVAALNLYGREPGPMAALSAAIVNAYDESEAITPDAPGLDAGGAHLVAGLMDAFAVRAVIQQAIGVLIGLHCCTAHRAYADLRIRAADDAMSLVDAAAAIIAEQRP